jgi:hypothetical protein
MLLSLMPTEAAEPMVPNKVTCVTTSVRFFQMLSLSLLILALMPA